MQFETYQMSSQTNIRLGTVGVSGEGERKEGGGVTVMCSSSESPSRQYRL